MRPSLNPRANEFHPGQRWKSIEPDRTRDIGIPHQTLAQVMGSLGPNPANITRLIEAGENPNAHFSSEHPFYPGMSLIHYAAQINDLNLLRSLKDNGAELHPNQPSADNHGDWASMTPTEMAVYNDNLEMLRYLYQNNGKIDHEKKISEPHRYYPGKSWLEVATINAVRSGAFDLVKFLIEDGADPNITVPGSGWNTPDLALVDYLGLQRHTVLWSLVLTKIPFAAQIRHLSILGSDSYHLPQTDPVKFRRDGLSFQDMIAILRTPKIINHIISDDFSAPAFETRQDLGSRTYSKAEIIGQLETFIESVFKREPIAGAPRAGTPEFERFYESIAARLQDIFEALKNPQIDAELKRTALLTLFSGSFFCGTARFNETLSAHVLLTSKTPEPDGLESKKVILESLYEFRLRCFLMSLPRYNESSEIDQHAYNAYMNRFGTAYGLASPEASYIDPIAPNISPQDEHQFGYNMLAWYNPAAIVSFIHGKISTGIISELLSDYGPPRLNQDQTRQLLELRRTQTNSPERESLEKQNQFFENYMDQMLDPDTGRPTLCGVHYLLTALDILKPNPLHHERFIDELMARKQHQPPRTSV